MHNAHCSVKVQAHCFPLIVWKMKETLKKKVGKNIMLLKVGKGREKALGRAGRGERIGKEKECLAHYMLHIA